MYYIYTRFPTWITVLHACIHAFKVVAVSLTTAKVEVLACLGFGIVIEARFQRTAGANVFFKRTDRFCCNEKNKCIENTKTFTFDENRLEEKR